MNIVDIKEGLLSVRNTIDMTLLAIEKNRYELVPTGV